MDKKFDELDSFLKTSYENNKLHKKKKKKIVVVIINIITISTLIAAGIGIKSINDYKKDLKNSEIYEKEIISKKPTEIEKEIENKEDIYDFNNLLSINDETVGWLKVKNTKIDTPVVQTNNNTYYLNHNFKKEYSSFGWVYADYRNDFNNLSKNTIMYGHTYKEDLMFSSLKNTLTDKWLDNEENYIIEFTTPKENYKFKVFSIWTTKNTDSYLKVDFSPQEFNEYINNSLSKSIRNFNTKIDESDKILTLSTCYLNSKNRLVVQAKLEETA